MALAGIVLAVWMAMLPGSLQENHEIVVRMSETYRIPILAKLASEPGSHLVLVREAPVFHHVDWINNDADIDGSRIVWARDPGLARVEELVRYFKGRRVWILYADSKPPVLQFLVQG